MGTGQHFEFGMVNIETKEERVNNFFTSSSFSIAKRNINGIPDGILFIIEGFKSFICDN